MTGKGYTLKQCTGCNMALMMHRDETITCSCDSASLGEPIPASWTIDERDAKEWREEERSEQESE